MHRLKALDKLTIRGGSVENVQDYHFQKLYICLDKTYIFRHLCTMLVNFRTSQETGLLSIFYLQALKAILIKLTWNITTMQTTSTKVG